MTEDKEDEYHIIKCTCGNDVKIYHDYTYESPFEFMCNECQSKEAWRFATRMLGLEKIRCVKCGWKLKRKNVDWRKTWEDRLGFKCPCCGYRFQLHHNDY